MVLTSSINRVFSPYRIRAATTRRKRAALDAGTPTYPIKDFPVQISVKSVNVPIEMLSARHIEEKLEVSGAKVSMTPNGGSSTGTWSGVSPPCQDFGS